MEARDIKIAQMEIINAQLMNKARENFLSFVKYTKRDYEINWHHRVLAEKLEKFARGEIKRLMVFMPPRHGKSELVSRRLPPYILGRNPKANIISASYNQLLASKMNRDVQRIIDDDTYRSLFPETRLDKTFANGDKPQGKFTRTSIEFEIVKHAGSYRACGIGGGITGTGADYFIIDDPVKDPAEAASETYRNRVWEWWIAAAQTRLSPQDCVLLTMTRWNVDDLAGRLLKDEPGVWDIISFPAIREDMSNPLDPRQIGEALWNGRFGLQRLNKIKRGAEDLGYWDSLYQQEPVVKGGNLLKIDWFKFVPRGTLPSSYDFTFITGDTAYKNKQMNDYTVFCYWGVVGKKLYLIDMLRKHINAIDVLGWCKDWVVSKNHYPFRYIWIEDAGHGIFLNQYFKEQGMTPTEDMMKEIMDRKTDKVTRANNVIARIDKNDYNVIINEEIEDIDAFKSEILSFPNGKHDDTIDNLIDGIMIGLEDKDVVAEYRRILGYDE